MKTCKNQCAGFQNQLFHKTQQRDNLTEILIPVFYFNRVFSSQGEPLCHRLKYVMHKYYLNCTNCIELQGLYALCDNVIPVTSFVISTAAFPLSYYCHHFGMDERPPYRLRWFRQSYKAESAPFKCPFWGKMHWCICCGKKWNACSILPLAKNSVKPKMVSLCFYQRVR